MTEAGREKVAEALPIWKEAHRPFERAIDAARAGALRARLDYISSPEFALRLNNKSSARQGRPRQDRPVHKPGHSDRISAPAAAYLPGSRPREPVACRRAGVRAARAALQLTSWLSALFRPVAFAFVACGFTVLVAAHASIWQKSLPNLCGGIG